MAWERFWERNNKRRPLPSLTEAIKTYGDRVLYPQPQYVEAGHCKWCNNLLEGRRTAFCSKECSDAFGRATVWGRNRGAYSMRILYRDNFICRRCGKSLALENCHGVLIPVDSQSSHAEVHHILPVSMGGGDEPENLATLCGECHKEVHRQLFATNVRWVPDKEHE